MLKIIALHIVLNAVSINDAHWLLDTAHNAGFNTVIVQLMNIKEVNGNLSAIPNGWTKTEFTEFCKYAQENGFDVIPELKLLTHQEKFLRRSHPELLYNDYTYNPDYLNDSGYYSKIFRLIDDIVDVTNAKVFHIGHDELWDPANGNEPLSADQFISDVNIVHDYLETKGILTMMWGDMMISPREFPTMITGPLNGIYPGYGRELLERLPRNMIIGDWHYNDTGSEFPTLKAFKDEGFTVLGASWNNKTNIRQFASYAKNNGADGMILTTWYLVAQQKWDRLQEIISYAGLKYRD